MGQRVKGAGRQLGDKVIILVQGDGVRIGEYMNIPNNSSGIVPDIHRGSNRQNRMTVSLAGVGIGGQLGVTEGIHDTVVANPAK